jgi:hypothetical protein
MNEKNKKNIFFNLLKLLINYFIKINYNKYNSLIRKKYKVITNLKIINHPNVLIP